jgi:IS30 family transposase
MGKPRRKYGESKEDYIKRAALEMYSEGYHISEIAPKLNTTQFKVYNAVMVSSSRTTTEEEREEMIYLRSKGMPYRDIAAIVGRSESCVRLRVKTPAKFNSRGGHHMSDKDLNKMKEWYSEGKTITWIAKKLGVNRDNVIHRIRKSDLYEPNKSKITPLTIAEKRKIDLMKSKRMMLDEMVEETGRDHNLIIKYINRGK